MLRNQAKWSTLFLFTIVAACTPANEETSGVVTSGAATSGAATSGVVTSGVVTQWDQPPELSIDPGKIYLAILETEKGSIKIELFARQTPVTVNNFIFLANAGFYDNTTFHRVLPDFMAQGGDPEGTGAGGPGYRFQDEIIPGLNFDEGGYLAMANSGPGTNGSQFFITFGPTEFLNGRHTIFGKVVEGMQVALSLTLRDPAASPDFEGDILQRVLIEEITASLLPTPEPTAVPVVPVLENGRPLASLEIAERENLYTGKPEMVIDLEKIYTAKVATTQGEFVILLDAISAPESVNNFVVLAQLGYYDAFPISFVDVDELVLIGSPASTATSDIGYTLPSELGLGNKRAAVGYWFRQDLLASSASQFYVLIEDQSLLNDIFTVFGEVIEGMDVVEMLSVDDLVQNIFIEVAE